VILKTETHTSGPESAFTALVLFTEGHIRKAKQEESVHLKREVAALVLGVCLLGPECICDHIAVP